MYISVGHKVISKNIWKIIQMKISEHKGTRHLIWINLVFLNQQKLVQYGQNMI